MEITEIKNWADPHGYKVQEDGNNITVSSREVTCVYKGDVIVTYVAGARFEETVKIRSTEDLIKHVHRRLNPWLPR
jgi:hypothetical protein